MNSNDPQLNSSEQIVVNLEHDAIDAEGLDDDTLVESASKKKKKKRHYVKKYCGGCWRVEKHFALNRNKSQIRVLAILTFGVYLLVRRFRCRVCGRSRMAVGE